MVIVGGGPAGAAAAITLARLGLQSSVREARQSPDFKIGECLPPSASAILERLGLNRRMREDGHLASYGNRSVWGSATPVERDFIFGTEGSGWQLDRLKFEVALATEARASGADWQDGHRLLQCTRHKSHWELTFQTPSGNDTLEADFVLDATGRAAHVARRFDARQIRYDRLIGVALPLQSGSGGGIAENLTLVEAVASGWWYSARVPDDKLMVVYLTDSDLIDHKNDTTTTGWLALLEETEHTLRRVREGDYRPLVEPRLLAANSSKLDYQFGEGWLAVGDAAAAFDPLSSYGISAALGSGFYAACATVDFLTGHTDALHSYQQLIDDAYAQYLSMHYDYYSLEQRWPHELFWQRRHARRPLR